MDGIHDEALRRLEGRVLDIAGQFTRKGLSPRNHLSLECKLQESLGEFGCRAETAVLERAWHRGSLTLLHRVDRGPDKNFVAMVNSRKIFRNTLQ